MARGRPPTDLLRCAQATGAAWSELRAAEAALARYRDRNQGRELDVAVKAMGEARAALRRAYDVLAPGKTRRLPRGPKTLWRCRYCQGLVFEDERREHLHYMHRIRTEAVEEQYLSVHFTFEPDEDDEDEMEGW